MGSMVQFNRPDGKPVSGYLAEPAQANAPAIVVIQEWWGLNAQIRGVADRLPTAGLCGCQQYASASAGLLWQAGRVFLNRIDR